MYTVINSITSQEIRLHNMFRCSSIFPDLELGENEQVAFIPNTLIEIINSAYECIITVDSSCTATAITITKTIEQWRQENPLPIPPKTELELLQEENEVLKTRVIRSEQIAAETSLAQQELLELLINMEVI